MFYPEVGARGGATYLTRQSGSTNLWPQCCPVIWTYLRKFIAFLTVTTVLLQGCAGGGSEAARQRDAREAALAAQVSQRMGPAALAATLECVRMIETGGFSEQSLLAGGFAKGTPPVTAMYIKDVSDPVSQGPFVTRPLRLAVNIGTSAAALGEPGCNIGLPSQGDGDKAFLIHATAALTQAGYTVSDVGVPIVAQKGASRVELGFRRELTGGTLRTSVVMRRSAN